MILLLQNIVNRLIEWNERRKWDAVHPTHWHL